MVTIALRFCDLLHSRATTPPLLCPTATTLDPNSTNNSATQPGTIVGPPADLAVAASGPASAAEGDTFTYTVTVTNNGPNAATDVVLTGRIEAAR